MKLKIIFPAIILIILVAMFVLTFQYKSAARTLPLIVCIPLIGLVVVQMVKELCVKRGKDDSSKTESISASKNIQAVGWIAALVILIFLLGFNVGIPLFSLAFLKAHRQSWLFSIVCTVLIFVMVYFGFGRLLKMDFYPGILLR